ncbi:hypothetical protein LTR74_017148 [Friedmanniomyces endolithicus]|nr:hypothetical protein LTR74_017148 [Friedmanniomyces endolithicus]
MPTPSTRAQESARKRPPVSDNGNMGAQRPAAHDLMQLGEHESHFDCLTLQRLELYIGANLEVFQLSGVVSRNRAVDIFCHLYPAPFVLSLYLLTTFQAADCETAGISQLFSEPDGAFDRPRSMWMFQRIRAEGGVVGAGQDTTRDSFLDPLTPYTSSVK